MKYLLRYFKYYFIIRGHGPWTGSLNQYLCSKDCVIFKIDEDYKQVVELFLKPYYNYIPINTNLSNLYEQIQYVNNNKLMKEIIINNRTFSNDFYKSDTLIYYMYQSLINLYKFN